VHECTVSFLEMYNVCYMEVKCTMAFAEVKMYCVIYIEMKYQCPVNRTLQMCVRGVPFIDGCLFRVFLQCNAGFCLN